MLLSLALSLVTAQIPDDQRTFGLLRDRRVDYEFVPFTPKERIQVAETALKMLQVYVNRESKISHYGQEVDPIPKVQDIISKAASLSDKEFHYQMIDAFTLLRDKHTVYMAPGPHGCLQSFKAIDFTITQINNTEQIVVKGFTNFEEVKRLSPEHANISVGDELLYIDDLPIQEYIKSRIPLDRGANEYGGKRQVLERMSLRFGAYDRPPDKDITTYQFKRYPGGEIYNVALPWVVGSRDVCYPPAKKIMDQARSGIRAKPSTEMQSLDSETGSSHFIEIRTKLKREAFEQMKGSIEETEVSDRLAYTIYKPESKNLGIIFIKSFNADRKADVDEFVDRLAELLTEELKNTTAVLFDIRGNVGGYVSMADCIPQLFKEDIQPLNFVTLNNRINQNIVNARNFPDKAWTKVFKGTARTKKYTDAAPLTDESMTNRLPPMYKKPVALLTDALCYSTCDMFAAQFQDHRLGPVFGVDGTTGGGGANVWAAPVFHSLDPKNFPKFPYADILPARARLMIFVSWRQTVRTGTNLGKPIEDIGVISEGEPIRPIQSDILPGSQTNSVYDRIADVLATTQIHSRTVRTNVNK